MKTSLVHLCFFITLLSAVHPITLLQLFGLSYLFEDSATVYYVKDIDGNKKPGLTVSPDAYAFLSTYQTRTDFCNYKCSLWYDMICFAVFGCNIQIRNVAIIVLGPLLFLVLLASCCGAGLWTCGCWWKYIKIFTGMWLVALLVEKFKKSLKQEQQRNIQEQRAKRQRAALETKRRVCEQQP